MDEFDVDKCLIDINCPKCSKIISEPIGKLKSDRIIICPACLDYFDIQADEIKKEINSVEASIKKLRDALKKFGKW